ncbi:hypothetical protein nvc2_009 [Namao virus]|nr:hypothetical protein nvc2_009 [Namao virus]
MHLYQDERLMAYFFTASFNDQKDLYKKLQALKALQQGQMSFMGIDFEFNSKNSIRVIASMQTTFYIRGKKYNYIFNPDTMLKHVKSYLIQHFLTNLSVYKILHGSESLDIYYLIFFLGERKKVDLMMKRYYDTKLLCEYEKYKYGVKMKCNIYDLLYSKNVITKEIYDFLLKNEKKVGPVYKIEIILENYNKRLFCYMVYDSFYLLELFLAFKSLTTKEIIMFQNVVHMSFMNLTAGDKFPVKFGSLGKKDNLYQKLFTKMIEGPYDIGDLYKGVPFFKKIIKAYFRFLFECGDHTLPFKVMKQMLQKKRLFQKMMLKI